MDNKELILGIDLNPETTEDELVKIKEMIFKLLPSRVFAGKYEEAVTLKRLIIRDEENGEITEEFYLEDLN